ncbi:MAG: formate dehydrogenase accessory sulfurtransferase FdhD [Hyphomicrobiaceae bacterium]
MTAIDPPARLGRLNPTGSVPASGTEHRPDGSTRVRGWQLAEEVPVAVLVNSLSHAVMMATPADLGDFARGFALTEGLVASVGDIAQVLVMPVENGIAVDIALVPGRSPGRDRGGRAIEGRSGCGICGVSEIEDVVRVEGRVARGIDVSAAAMLSAGRALAAAQPINALNRSVHAAAWCDRDGRILMVREDVGRHNALDKLIGALAVAGTDMRTGFVLMSSRCSFELVQKAAIAGVTALVTVSAPTALALGIAERTGLRLAALAGDGVIVFNE